MKMLERPRRLNEAAAWEALQDVKDPEIPTISLVEMGIVRSIEVDGARVRVAFTPTYSGCPALQVMQDDIERRLLELGFREVLLELVVGPAWTSDAITVEGREKLRAFGIAPPPRIGEAGSLTIDLVESATCPHCASSRVTLKNPFGPTICRVIWFCEDCQQPFEQFKPI